jgi:flotillin
MSLLAAMSGGAIAALIVVLVLILASIVLLFLTRYKKCPSDKVMVIYGKIGKDKDGNERSAKCIHGGAAFVLPVVQSHAFLDLTPISIGVDLKNALSKQNIRVDVPSRFTVGISTETVIMQNAAERLLGLSLSEIQELAKDIILGQLRLVIATMEIEEINNDRDKFLKEVSEKVESELKKIGLRLINVNVTDISDESGYINALGKEAAAKAINDAKIAVAEEDKKGSIGAANAMKEQRINVSAAEAESISGENTAKAKIANAQAQLKEAEAEAQRLATVAEKTKAAEAMQASYSAEKLAELARAEREQATLEADIIVKSDIEKRRKEIEAEAEAEQIRRKARGEADAIYAKMEAQARGIKAILDNQASGYAEMVNAAGGDPNAAMRLMITDKLEKIVSTQVEAIKGVKIDKVTVWDNGGTGDGKTSTAGFLSGLMKSLPPLNDLFNMAGLQLPELLNVEKKEQKAEPEKPQEEVEA